MRIRRRERFEVFADRLAALLIGPLLPVPQFVVARVQRGKAFSESGRQRVDGIGEGDDRAA